MDLKITKKTEKLIVALLAGLFSASVVAIGDPTPPKRYLEGLPLIGSAFADDDRNKNDIHEDGVYYHNISSRLFAKINFNFQKGSLRNNLDRAAKEYGWKMIWELDTDYDIPAGFTVNHRRLPEVFANALIHLPIRVMFYSKNKVIIVLPMYDKRETEVGGKYTISR